jgi:hypothetical protein
MKAIATFSLLLLLFTTAALAGGTLAFVPAPGNKVPRAAPHSTTNRERARPFHSNMSNMRDDSMKIAQERLQHLGTEIKKHILHTQVVDEGDTSVSKSQSHPTEEHEESTSTIHKLRDEMFERDAQHRSMLQAIQDAVAGLSIMLETEARTLQAENRVIERNIQMYEDEYESVRSLLARAGKLMMRRIMKAIRAVLCFVRLQKKKE